MTPLPVPHGNSLVNGYLFARGGTKLVAYLSDCSGVPDDVAAQITGVKVLVIDALAAETAPDASERAQALEVAERVQRGADILHPHRARAAAFRGSRSAAAARASLTTA